MALQGLGENLLRIFLGDVPSLPPREALRTPRRPFRDLAAGNAGAARPGADGADKPCATEPTGGLWTPVGKALPAVSTPVCTPLPRIRQSNEGGPLGTRGKAPSIAAFRRQRDALAAAAFAEFNASVFDGRLPADLAMGWNAHLKTTAGLTHYRREAAGEAGAHLRYSARVELSAKVVDAPAKLRATLLHELCHVAAWLLPPHVAKPPHGPAFKFWAGCALRAHPELPVTTCHAYQIHAPFRWRCKSACCGREYQRHSNSIDVARQACGECRGRLVFLGRFNPDNTPMKTRAPSGFSLFVRDNFAAAKAAAGPGEPHAAVMRALSERWRSRKAALAGATAE
ncbi:hypothetical protein WJX81_007148 [Elliptochloris bilobata]|uniref:SprT-like domain-containing protein n=1 Tax=Elliptochloris bilobata TaxID=381761 RepID=A0AAW1RVU9_9CHLO